MKLNDTFEQAWNAMNREIEKGRAIEMEIYNGGDGFHTDTIGEFIGNADGKKVNGITIQDNAACRYQIMDKEDYANSLLANCGTTTDEYFDDLDEIIVVIVDYDGENFATAE